MLLEMPCRSIRKEMEARPAAETFQLCSWPHLCSLLLKPDCQTGSCFPPPAVRAGQLTHATSHPRRSPLYMFLPSTYFAITSVRNGCDGQGGIVGAVEHQGVGRGQDKGCCVSSMTISGAGSHRGTAALQGALLLPSVPLLSWREGNPTAVGAGVPGLEGDALCSSCSP